LADSCDAIRDFVDMAFCTSRLRSVPGAATADRPGPYGGGPGGRARRAGIETNDPATRDALEACGMLYSAASVPALRLLRGYAAARSWGAARALLLLTGQAGIGCEATFAGSAYAAGRMAAANREFDQLSTMATALLNKVN